MAVTNQQAGTRIDEIADGIYRISTPLREIPGGFSFNQYLLTGDQPLLFHTGPRRMRPLVQEAISSVLDVSALRFIGFSHYESDECGSSAACVCRRPLDYYSHTKNVRSLIAGLAAAEPTLLACMHGSAWQGDGGQLLLALAESLDG